MCRGIRRVCVKFVAGECTLCVAPTVGQLKRGQNCVVQVTTCGQVRDSQVYMIDQSTLVVHRGL